jgi:hypothetical protein
MSAATPTVPPADRVAVRQLLGREPEGWFEVVIRHAADGSPVVVRNHPLLRDGTPMPTRFWLVGEPERAWVSTIESEGGVREAAAAVDDQALALAHAAYGAERDAVLPVGHAGPAPSGGVGGTRIGVKCLHAHYAWFLAGGSDPVGQWVHARLLEQGRALPAVTGIGEGPPVVEQGSLTGVAAADRIAAGPTTEVR